MHSSLFGTGTLPSWFERRTCCKAIDSLPQRIQKYRLSRTRLSRICKHNSPSIHFYLSPRLPCPRTTNPNNSNLHRNLHSEGPQLCRILRLMRRGHSDQVKKGHPFFDFLGGWCWREPPSESNTTWGLGAWQMASTGSWDRTKLIYQWKTTYLNIDGIQHGECGVSLGWPFLFNRSFQRRHSCCVSIFVCWCSGKVNLGSTLLAHIWGALKSHCMTRSCI